MGIPQQLISKGCSTCNNYGYKGRVAIYELMKINDTLKRTIMHGKEIALKNGMKTLRGMTTLDEVLSVTGG